MTATRKIRWTQGRSYALPERRRLAAILLALGIWLLAFGQDVFQPVDLRTKTHIASGYFGPNALPVFDMLDGRVDSTLRIEAAADWHKGTYGDHTMSAFVKLKIPLFTRRVNLSVWWTAQEWYWNTTEKQIRSRVSTDYPLHGHATGDIFISTDIQCVYEGRWWPSAAVRVGIKTAPSADYELGRYFDSPAYFLDAHSGKSFALPGSFCKSLRIAGSVGFLCWQTETGRQNDAITYGAQVSLDTRLFNIIATYGGYSGWERDGDRPMTIKAHCGFYAPLTLSKSERKTIFEPYIEYAYGLRDYPYRHLRVGLAWSVDIIRKQPLR